MGEAMSGEAEQDNNENEKRREQWELQNNPRGERDEMVELYTERGIDKEDAEDMIRIMSQAKYKDLFIDVMMAEELGIIVEEDADPWGEGLYCGLSFVFFGTWPLLGYIFLNTAVRSSAVLFIVACLITATMLFVLGVCKSIFSLKHWFASGLETLLVGGGTAVVAYLIGWVVAALVG